MKNPTRKVFISFLLCFFLWFLRVWKLEKVGLQEYDSVYNFLVIRQISEGNFENLFQHLSPSFFLFFAAIYKIIPDFLILEYINALLSVLAVWCFVAWLSKIFSYSFLEKMLFLLFLGLSTYGVYGTRSLTIEALSSLLFVGILWAYSEKKWLFFYGFVGFMLTVNYKILLLVPFALVVFLTSILSRNNISLRNVISKIFQLCRSFDLKNLFLSILPMFFYQFLGMVLGLSWKNYPAKWWFVLFGQRKNVNVWHEAHFFYFDLDYYFQYLFRFESPILLIALISSVFSLLKNTHTLKRMLLFITVFTLFEMSFLAKAPRGILFILPILYFLAFETLKQVFCNIDFSLCHRLKSMLQINILKKWNFYVVLFLLFSYQFYLLKTHIYDYTETYYPKIVEYLEQEKITKLVGTVGINIQAFLPQSIDYQIIRFEKEIPNWQKKGYEYCLIDDYHRLVGAEVFDSLRSLKPIMEFKEPTLFSPLLYLEHCEFTGMTFQEALQTQKGVSQDRSNLRLIKLGKVVKLD